MDDSVHTGGTAFPKMKEEIIGLTVRDYASLKILQGMLAGPYWCENADSTSPSSEQALIDQAMHLADIWMRERR